MNCVASWDVAILDSRGAHDSSWYRVGIVAESTMNCVAPWDARKLETAATLTVPIKNELVITRRTTDQNI